MVLYKFLGMYLYSFYIFLIKEKLYLFNKGIIFKQIKVKF